MWDNNAPLQLLKTMPKRLNQENLEKIQLLIDADKYKNSIISGFDLCGIFAPFCRGCDKTSIYPCAVSYIRMLQSEGMEIEIDASPSSFTAQPYAPQIDIPKTKPVTAKQAEAKPYERRPVNKSYERKVAENKPSVKQAEPKQPYEVKYPEQKAAEPKAVVKQTEVFTVKETAPQYAPTPATPPPVTDKSKLFPLTEDKPVEDKYKVSENSYLQEEQVEKPVNSVYNPVQNNNEADRTKEERQPDKEAAPRKLRIAVARRKLQ